MKNDNDNTPCSVYYYSVCLLSAALNAGALKAGCQSFHCSSAGNKRDVPL